MKWLLCICMFFSALNLEYLSAIPVNPTIEIVPTSPPPKRIKDFHIGAVIGGVTPNIQIQSGPITTNGLVELLTTATFFQLPEVDFLAIGQTQSNGQLKSILKYIDQFEDDDVALIVDGHKSLFLADAPTIFKTFQRIGSDFVIAATRCHPNVGAVNSFSDSPRTLNFPDSSSFMGKISSMKVIVQRLIKLSKKYPHYNLTELFNVDYSKHKSSYALDYHALLFFDLCGVSPENGDIVVRNLPPYVRVHLHEAHSRPKVINSEGDMGGGDSLKNDIYNAIFFSFFIPRGLNSFKLNDALQDSNSQPKGCPCRGQRPLQGNQTDTGTPNQRLDRVRQFLQERSDKNKKNESQESQNQPGNEVKIDSNEK